MFILDIEKLTSALETTLKCLKDTKSLNLEVAQLSRFIFMNCKQFSNMRGLNEMKKSHQALLRYLNLNVTSIIESFLGFISNEGHFVIVPHRESLDFILIRLQGLSKLLIRAVKTLRNSSRFFFGLLKAGSFYAKGTIILATISKVWSQCRDFCVSIVENYNNLYELRDKLKQIEIKENVELPQKLDVWLEDDWTSFIINQTFDDKFLNNEYKIEQSTKKSEEEGIISRYLQNENPINPQVKEEEIKVEKVQENSMEIDDFTPISRSSLKISKSAEPNLLTKKNILKFIENEIHLRKSDTKKSLTYRKMNKKIWKEFINDIKNKYNLMQENLLVEYVNDYLDEYKIF